VRFKYLFAIALLDASLDALATGEVCTSQDKQVTGAQVAAADDRYESIDHGGIHTFYARKRSQSIEVRAWWKLTAQNLASDQLAHLLHYAQSQTHPCY
jgi:hypothetical protein